jgi:hypothetical protein
MWRAWATHAGAACLLSWLGWRSSCPPAAVQAALPKFNMNQTGDDHVSFSAMRLALSPCGRCGVGGGG